MEHAHTFTQANLTHLLSQNYALTPDMITEIVGGWSAYAFKVITPTTSYFLKAYDKKRASTARLVTNINCYASFLAELPPNLAHHVPQIIKTVRGNFYSEDRAGIYLLHDFIEGETIGKNQLTTIEIQQFADFISALHQLEPRHIKKQTLSCEDFEINTLADLQPLIEKAQTIAQLNTLIAPYSTKINVLVQSLIRQSNTLRTAPPKFVFCHQDLHHGNLIRSSKGLYIVDWEGLLLAPKEADLMFIQQQDYYDDFLTNYRTSEPINGMLIQYYIKRRLFDDLFEWLELALETTPHIPQNTLDALVHELQRWP